jgi:hypothetical protein
MILIIIAISFRMLLSTCAAVIPGKRKAATCDRQCLTSPRQTHTCTTSAVKKLQITEVVYSSRRRSCASALSLPYMYFVKHTHTHTHIISKPQKKNTPHNTNSENYFGRWE